MGSASRLFREDARDHCGLPGLAPGSSAAALVTSTHLGRCPGLRRCLCTQLSTTTVPELGCCGLIRELCDEPERDRPCAAGPCTLARRSLHGAPLSGSSRCGGAVGALPPEQPSSTGSAHAWILSWIGSGWLRWDPGCGHVGIERPVRRVARYVHTAAVVPARERSYGFVHWP